MKKFFLTLLTAALFYSGWSQRLPGSDSTTAKAYSDTAAPKTGLFVNPSSIAFQLQNGQAATQTITISNKLAERNQFKIYLGDWERDSSGKHEYYDPGTLSRSCARWVSVDKDVVELEPGQSTTVSLRMQVPDSIEVIKEMKWTMLFVELVKERKPPPVFGKDISAQINYQFRFGLHVLQTPPTLSEKSLKMLSFDPLYVTKDSTSFLMGCRNDGDLQIKCFAAMELTNLTSGVKIRTEPVEFNIFPKARRFAKLKFPQNMPPGKYSILAMLDGGEDIPLEAVQREVEIK